ncbi:MAG: hypothetical protein IPJ41_07215 [Phycisphaerales bacterium]|nr:hypothetical protein [Phycisphaerales bacterium]
MRTGSCSSQLSGGNDGLNTVVPFGFDQYYRARPAINIPQGQALRLDQKSNQGVGLHPGLAKFKDLHDRGMLSVIQGVGYPNPNRSHFKSMDIWQTADTTGTGDGWIGKYFDAECCGYGKGESGTPEADKPAESQGQPGIAIGAEAPLAMQGRKVKPISFETPTSSGGRGRMYTSASPSPTRRSPSTACARASIPTRPPDS